MEEKAQDEVREAFANDFLRTSLFLESKTLGKRFTPGIPTIHKMVVEMLDEVPHVPELESVNQVVKEDVEQVKEEKKEETP
jgi:hypothetical protein